MIQCIETFLRNPLGQVAPTYFLGGFIVLLSRNFDYFPTSKNWIMIVNELDPRKR